MSTIDLGKRREEAQLVAHTITLDGHEWRLPPVLTGDTLKGIAALARIGSASPEEVQDAYVSLFGDGAADAMRLLGVLEVIDVVSECYGLSPGESPASDAP